MRRLLPIVVVVLAAFVAPRALAAPDPKPNDPLLADQWALAQIRADQAWALTRGAGAVIAVIDSGVDRRHPDLAPNVLPGISFDTEAGCQRGCSDGSPAVPEGQEEVDGHGTHVAGIAAAVANNRTGIAGVAPGARILPVRVESPEDVVAGIRWAADHGASVINLSLGIGAGAEGVLVPGSGLVLRGLEDAVAHAHRKGVVVVAAAGNSTFPLCENPSDIDGVLCVAATDRSGRPAEYSNLPNKDDGLWVRAPGGSGALSVVCGEGVLSTVPGGTGLDACDYPTSKHYDEMVGTSMAAPHVSGVAALLRSLGCDRRQAIDVIVGTARGEWGLLDAGAAVKRAATACHGGTTGT